MKDQVFRFKSTASSVQTSSDFLNDLQCKFDDLLEIRGWSFDF